MHEGQMKRWMKCSMAGALFFLLAAQKVWGNTLWPQPFGLLPGITSEMAGEIVPVNYFKGEYLVNYRGDWHLLTRTGEPVTGLVHLDVAFGDCEPGFYYFMEDGRLETGPKVHKFKEVTVYGATFDGYYYHEANGRFYAKARGLRKLEGLTCNGRRYDGIYYIGKLGKLARRQRPRYLETQEADGETYSRGWYYFEEGGALCQEKTAHGIHGKFDGREFDGTYYFIEDKARLDDRYAIVESAGEELVEYSDFVNMGELKRNLEKTIQGYDGEWAVYVKNLDTEESFSIQDKPMYSASMIKSFVMAAVYESMEKGRMARDTVIERLLEQMIAVSDNEAYNELVRRIGKDNSFSKGTDWVNAWLTVNDYEDTGCHHTLAPSVSASAGDGTGERNVTSVSDCGKLLESIYREECVSKEASQEMENLLLDQQNRTKIPAGVPDGILVANKTGETDTQTHDMAIVWGESHTYILCVMSSGFKNEGTAITHVGEISRQVYETLNSKEIKVWRRME